MNKLKILILATAKTGNVWLRALLSHLYQLPIIEGDLVEHAFDPQIFNQFGDRWITHKHYPFSEEILQFAQQNNIILLTSFRHPGDILVSYFHFVKWITHSNDDEIALLRKDNDQMGENTHYFVESEMFIHHLVVTYHWKPHCLDCIFYEDLLENPIQILTDLSNKIQPVQPEQILRAVAASQMKYLKVDREGNHFRKGGNLQWQSEIPPKTIECFKNIESYIILCWEMGYSFETNHVIPQLRSNAKISKFNYSSIDPFQNVTHFDNNIKITIEMIRCYFSTPNALSRWQFPAHTVSQNSFFNWLNQPCELLRKNISSALISNFGYFLYNTREDLQLAFPDLLGKNRLEFAQWFVEQMPLEYEIDHIFLKPVSNVIGRFTMNSIDIIVPVYKGLEETQACLESVLVSNSSLKYELIVINDCSPEPELVDYLNQLATDNKITLLHNEENLGFVGTVNRGMALHSDRDVLLLNSDAEVFNDWLDRISNCAYQEEKIATVTPFSNNATICSYPRFCEDNELLENISVNELDLVFSRANLGKYVEIPTAVGFCMFIKRACLEEIGLFDVENFGKGYGEENDFCMRAQKKGWSNVLCADTFVYHKGAVSFGKDNSAKIDKAMQVLNKLHPTYHLLVHTFIHKDPIAKYRRQVDVALLQNSNKINILCIDHGMTGGTIKHIYELAHLLNEQANFLRLRPSNDGLTKLSWINTQHDFSYAEEQRKELAEFYFQLPEEFELLVETLKHLNIAHLHFHHTMALHPIVWLLPDTLQLKYDFTVHDYYSCCPQVSLTNEEYQYCGESNDTDCNSCLKERPAPDNVDIANWRKPQQKLLEEAQRVFIPSYDAAKRIQSYFKNIKAIVTPHPDHELNNYDLTPVRKMAFQNEEYLRIVVIGALSPIKGADLLEACALDAKKNKLPIEFHLIGFAYRSLKKRPQSNLIEYGAYQDEELDELLAGINPHLVWFPAQWPETYSYTLSAVLKAGLPMFCTNLGAIPERIIGRAYSWIFPFDTKPEIWNEAFVQLRKGEQVKSPVQMLSAPPRTTFSYQKDYLTPMSIPQFEITPLREELLNLIYSPYRPNTLKNRLLKKTKRWVLQGITIAYSVPLIKSLATNRFSLAFREKVNRWLAR
ncbi:MAG: hypothetical protein RIT27_1768 [Pseudomonadota bacterium]|jgi:GT2 family glycosyltransferase